MKFTQGLHRLALIYRLHVYISIVSLFRLDEGLGTILATIDVLIRVLAWTLPTMGGWNRLHHQSVVIAGRGKGVFNFIGEHDRLSMFEKGALW